MPNAPRARSASKTCACRRRQSARTMPIASRAKSASNERVRPRAARVHAGFCTAPSGYDLREQRCAWLRRPSARRILHCAIGLRSARTTMCVAAPPECTQDSALRHRAMICENNDVRARRRQSAHRILTAPRAKSASTTRCVDERECLITAHCDPGYICVRTKCVPDIECTQDWQCDAGEICIDQECVYTGANRCPYFFGATTTPVGSVQRQPHQCLV